MFTDTRTEKIVNIEHEDGSDVIWIDRLTFATGKTRAYCVPVAPWGDAKQMVIAAKKIARLIF